MNEELVGRHRPLGRRVAVTTVLAVASLLLAWIPAPPAHADSPGESVIGVTMSVIGGGEIFSGQSVPYGTGIHFHMFIRDISGSCSPVQFDCDAPTGTVAVVDNGVVLGAAEVRPQNDFSSLADFELAGGAFADLEAGRHEFFFNYTGNLDPSSDGPIVLFVDKANCAITISQDSSQTTFGQPVEFLGELGGLGHAGEIWFTDPIGHLLGTAPLFFGVVGKLTISTLPVGFTDVRAVYTGDANHNSCASGFVRHTVIASTTSTSVVSSPNPSTIGQFATFTASVTGGSTTATGTVTFSEGATTLATRNLFGGVASFATADLPIGSHTITARYDGDGTHATSIGQAVHVVSGLATTTALASSPNPSVWSDAVTLTATVTAASSTPTGDVSFYDDGAWLVLGSAALDGNGVASLTTTSLPAGIRHIVAVYNGDATHASSSGAVDQSVNRVATTTALTASANPSLVGGSVTFTASVSPASTAGFVEFRDGAAAIAACASQPLTNGIATCAVTYQGAGGHTITAHYLGSSTHEPSDSAALSHTVIRVPTTVQLTVPDTPSVVGVPIVYTAAVSPAAATGTVRFEDGGIAITGCSLRPIVNGEASCTMTWPAPGDHSLVAVFSGDTTFAPSESAARAVRVAKAPTQLTAVPAAYVGRFSVTVSARSLHALTGAPIGGQRVEFYAGTKLVCATLTDAIGVAQCSGGKVAVAAMRSRAEYVAISQETATYLGASNTAPA